MAFQQLGVRRIDSSGCYHSGMRLARAIGIGDYQTSIRPEDPTVLSMVRAPLTPGLTAQEQWRAGRKELLATTFEMFEREIRDQLGRTLGAGGFDPARDIGAITVNRWPHGYAYGQDMETREEPRGSGRLRNHRGSHPAADERQGGSGLRGPRRGEEYVAKVYKEARQRTFKHRVEYTEGRRTRNSRDQRAVSKRTRHGRKQDEAAWRSARWT